MHCYLCVVSFQWWKSTSNRDVSDRPVFGMILSRRPNYYWYITRGPFTTNWKCRGLKIRNQVYLTVFQIHSSKDSGSTLKIDLGLSVPQLKPGLPYFLSPHLYSE